MATTIDNALSEMRSIALSSERFTYRWAYDAVNYYVSSGRAYVTWIKAFIKADKYKLLEYMTSGTSRSDQSMIKRATTFINRAN